MIFHFSKRTEQAINLGKISDKEPCISEYEDEAEVLVFPETLFFVKQIHMDPNFTLIHLEHLFIRPSSIISAAKGLYDIVKDDKKLIFSRIEDNFTMQTWMFMTFLDELNKVYKNMFPHKLTTTID